MNDAPSIDGSHDIDLFGIYIVLATVLTSTKGVNSLVARSLHS